MRHIVIAVPMALFLSSEAVAQDTGPLPETFSATYVATDTGCLGLLMTGQFMAPTPGYRISLSEAKSQTGTPTTYGLDMTATPPSGNVLQVLTPVPVTYENAGFDQCPYGITVTFEDDTFIVPFFPRD
ncbi:hypothetical protein [uncultured Roseobacter sp.]|uniref:hypothetical protein n=1 Tax=uncultured Roseobacter sp. TaxID=114847 RepID=UPI00262C41F0|nr:hypothetical protein [uncultured Roseobacter sp.]